MEKTLLPSSIKMTNADGYNDWTFELFQSYVHADVLEVGCGTGSFTQRLISQGRFKSLLSIDLSKEAIEYCQSRFKHPSVEYRVSDIIEVEGAYDLIICMNVLEHIEYDEAALKQMLTLLKPGGRLFLLVPAHQAAFTAFDVAVGHHRRYNKQNMKALFRKIGTPKVILEQYYFNLIGLLGYYFVYKIMKADPVLGGDREITFFDKWIVPVVKRIEGRWLPAGISLIAVFSKD